VGNGAIDWTSEYPSYWNFKACQAMNTSDSTSWKPIPYCAVKFDTNGINKT